MKFFESVGLRDCRFIEGKAAGGKTECCGKPQINHSSWCEEHFNRVFMNAAQIKSRLLTTSKNREEFRKRARGG